RRFRCARALVVMGLVLVASTAFAGERAADPREMDRALRGARPGPLDPRVVGAWDVWIPGSVYYLSDGRQVTGHYQAGAAMNRLEIQADGSYRWGERRGRLGEVQRWQHQPGRRYYRVVDASGNEYEFYLGDGDKLVVLFGSVGGHAATGTRLAGATVSARPGTAAPTPAPAATVAAGAKVQIKWGNAWYPGRVLRVDGARYLVGYDGYGSTWDEWVDSSRIKADGGPSPAPSPTAPAPAAPAPSPTADNPLGVEWRTASPPAPSAPAAPATPATPSPEPPPAPPVAPEAPASLPVVDRWKFIAASYHGGGRVDNAADVSGMLVLDEDGSYDQTLVIGGIANVISGTWRQAGERLTLSYLWRGQPTSDTYTMHLRADGKQLTLVRPGSPTVYYTLERIE